MTSVLAQILSLVQTRPHIAARLLRDLSAYVVIYVIILWLIPKRWLPPNGSAGEAAFSRATMRREWKALVAVGIVTLFVLRWPELLVGIVLIRFGDFVWHRFRHRAKEIP